ncbi:PE family protein [Mycobacterium haemophilum]|nr:PE family protein [Mycobacterium haemophilum]MCV7340955.1 PE family protein [Mycobacterium haemophilum DSM 44634]
MSFVTVNPQVVDDISRYAETVADFLDDRSTEAANMTNLAPAAADKVSTVAAKYLSQQAQNFDELSAQYAQILRQYANALQTAAVAYSATEADNIENIG